METPLASTSSDVHRWKYHVFLSFRGEDNRFQFTDHLYQALRSKGIEVFRDKEGLRTGQEISPALLQAIEETRIAIIVLSENYASSSWCLDELVKILECKKEKGLEVLRVFYNVDPSDVRNQRGSYGKALDDHAIRFHDDFQKVEKWRSALRQASNLSGESYSRNCYESQFIEKIIEKISSFLNLPFLHIAENPVGLDSRKSEVVSLLRLEDYDLCMGGIFGIGGSGKTTIAKAVYNLIASQFECTCFLADIRESSTRQGLVGLQERILMDMLGDNLKLSNVHQGISIMRDRLSHRKVLLILDDVDNLRHLQTLAGESSWFGPGSRVIITTRDRHLLVAHGVQGMYEVKGFSKHEALELFCWNAFKKRQPPAGYTQLAAGALNYAKGLPLALEIIGSHLNGKDKDEWECTLTKYQRNINKDICNVLRISYDQLEFNEKEILLDIAFFFKGVSLGYVEKILEACGFFSKSGIRVLEDRSFLKIRGGRIWMHDLIQGMGRDIVRQESEREPSERSRLACQDDILSVLSRDTGTSKIQGIVLNMPQLTEVPWSGEAFKDMVNLRILIIRNAIFSKAPHRLPNSLRVLDWTEYPSSSLPSGFDGSRLLFLDVGHVRPLHLERRFKKFQNLAYLTINNSKWLKEVPDVSMIPKLVELCLDFCSNLVKIHDSVGRLENLEHFSAVACVQLKDFPAGNALKSLKLLNLSLCQSITKFPDVSQSKYLERLHLSDTSIDMESISIPDLKYTYVVLPGVRIPGYFQYHTNQESVSFWIRREFPALAVSFALSTNEDLSMELCVSVGRFKATLRKGNFLSGSSYVLIFNLPSAFTEQDYRAVEAEIQEGWVQVDLFGAVTNSRSSSSSRDEMPVGGNIIKECGVLVYDRKSRRDISFSDPYPGVSVMSRSNLAEVKESEKPLQTVIAEDAPVSSSSSYFLNTVKRLLTFRKRKEGNNSHEMWKSRDRSITSQKRMDRWNKEMIREVDEYEDKDEKSFLM